jgi:hypothetical protein
LVYRLAVIANASPAGQIVDDNRTLDAAKCTCAGVIPARPIPHNLGELIERHGQTRDLATGGA